MPGGISADDVTKVGLWPMVSAFKFVVNVGPQIAALYPEQAFLRTRLCEVGAALHPLHYADGSVV